MESELEFGEIESNRIEFDRQTNHGHLLNITVHRIDGAIELIALLCPSDDRIEKVCCVSILLLLKLIGDCGLVVILLIHVRDKRWTNARPEITRKMHFYSSFNSKFNPVFIVKSMLTHSMFVFAERISTENPIR